MSRELERNSKLQTLLIMQYYHLPLQFQACGFQRPIPGDKDPETQ